MKIKIDGKEIELPEGACGCDARAKLHPHRSGYSLVIERHGHDAVDRIINDTTPLQEGDEIWPTPPAMG